MWLSLLSPQKKALKKKVCVSEFYSDKSRKKQHLKQSPFESTCKNIQYINMKNKLNENSS